MSKNTNSGNSADKDPGWDKVIIECPSCESFVPVTTYLGENKRVEYPLYKAPLVLIAEVQRESKEGRIRCMSCGDDLSLIVQFMVSVKSVDDTARFDKDWRVTP